jgi:hypothetical protein
MIENPRYQYGFAGPYWFWLAPYWFWLAPYWFWLAPDWFGVRRTCHPLLLGPLALQQLI